MTNPTSNVSPSTQSSQPARGRSRKKLVLGLGVGALVALAGVVALAPTIASSFAPGIIASQASKFVKGKVQVSDASFSWGGPQRITNLTWTDEQGKHIAQATLSAGAGLLSLARGNLDLGEVVVSDTTLSLVRHQDGQLNVVKLLQPPAAGAGTAPAPQPGQAPGAKQPIQLPKGLKVKLTIKNVDVTLTDEAGPGGPPQPTIVRLADVAGNATIDPSLPLVARLSANASNEGVGTGSGGGAAARSGSLALDISATNWADSAGTLTLDKATLASKVDIKNLPTSLVDALAGPMVRDDAGNAVPLAKALGDALSLTLDATGTLANADAAINLLMPRVSAMGTLAIADGVLSTKTPLRASLEGSALADLVPALQASLKPSTSDAAKLDALPGVVVSIEGLRTKLPQGGTPLDLRGTTATITLKTDEITGQVPGPVAGQATQAMQPMRLAPLDVLLTTPDLAQGVKLSATTSATLSNQPAGTITISADVSGLLDAQGAPTKGLPSSINARAQVQQIATSVAQPFVQALGLDLARDVGPTLDLDMRAKTVGAASAGAKAPPLDIDLRATSTLLRATGAFTLRDDALVGRNIDKAPVLVLEADAGGRIASALTARGVGGFSVSAAPGSSGKATARINWLTVPLTSTRQPRLDQAEGSFVANFEQLVLAKVPTPGSPAGQGSFEPLVIPSLSTALGLDKGGRVVVEAQGQVRYANQSGGFALNAKVPDAIRAVPDAKAPTAPWTIADPITLRPEVTLDLVSMPTSLLSLVVPPPSVDPATGKAGLDVASLLREVVGPSIGIKVLTKPEASGALALTASADSGPFKLATSASLAPTTIAFQGLEVRSTLSPDVASRVLALLVPDMPEAQRPRLVGPAQGVLTLAPLAIPLDASRKPKLAEAGVLKARFALPGRVLLDNLATSQTQRARAGVEEFTLDIEAPVASLLAPDQGGKQGDASVSWQGGLWGGQSGTSEQALGRMLGTSTIGLLGAKPQGVRAELALSGLSTRGLDTLLGQQGLLSGALGDSADVRVVGSSNADASQGEASVSIAAPNLTTTGPLKVRQEPTRLVLVEPARFTLRAQPSFVDALLKPKEASPASQANNAGPAISLTSETVIDLAINKLVLPRASMGPGAAPAQGSPASAPEVALALTIPQAVLRTSDNQPLTLGNTRITIEPATNVQGMSANDKPIAFSVAVESVRVPDASGQAAGPSGSIALSGNVRNLVDQAGAFGMQGAVLDARGDMPAVPTALLDVLAKKDGLLVEALGPIIEVKLLAERYPLLGKPVPGVAPGLLDLQARSERASASIRGDLNDSVLVSNQPITANLVEVSAGLAGRLVKGLPLLGTFEKKREDRAASITATSMRIPLSNDLSKLSGDVTIDPGQLRFGAGSEFSQLLNLAKIRTNTSVGTRLDPLTINIKDGVATYPKWRVPLGEFTMETQGTVDLVNRQVDVVTYIPFGALADEAAGLFNTGAGGKLNELLGGASPILNAASMMPFRTKGSMDNPSTGPDLELFGKQFLEQLKPENLIEKGIGDLFKGLRPEKK